MREREKKRAKIQKKRRTERRIYYSGKTVRVIISQIAMRMYEL